MPDLSSLKMVCPAHSAKLSVRQETSGAYLCCDNGCKHPIIDGIPRFVPKENYASSFGLQWKTFRKTQLDSYSGTTISRDRLTRILGGNLDIVRGKNVLEAGCGAGRFTEILLAAGANVFACDLSDAVEANYDNCRGFLNQSNYFVCQADIRDLPLAPQQFDIVICIGVIQHTPNPEATIASLCAHVRPGGMLAIDHYTHGYALTPSREMLRNLLLQVAPESALKFCTELAGLLWPTHIYFWQNRHDPIIGPLRERFLEQSPLVDYLDAYPQLGEQLKTWAILDTHDTLTDTYKHLRSAEEIAATLKANSMQDISVVYAGNGVEARAIKHHDDPPYIEVSQQPENNHAAAPAKTKVMFLAWGYSIHAKRRISIFTEDPAFDVSVVSTHNYDFDNTVNVLLDGRQQERYEITNESPELPIIIELARQQGVTDLSLITAEILSGIHDYRILQNAVAQFKPDVIFLQTLLYPCYLAHFLPKSIPRIVTFWNGDVTWWAEWDGIDRILKKQIVVHGAVSAHAVTVNSKKAMQACVDYGVPKKNIHLIRYPGADMQRFMPRDKNEAKTTLGLSSKYVVLCPRGLGSYLNSDSIIEAAHIVCSILADIMFVFVSNVGIELWESHLGHARALGISHCLRHDGIVEWEKMPYYYNAADAMVSVSSNDSLPNCMLESMASGTPVIMGDIESIREWVSDGETGHLVPVEDCQALASKILEVLSHTPSRSDCITNNAHNLIEREANSHVNSTKIKTLVKRIHTETAPVIFTHC